MWVFCLLFVVVAVYMAYEGKSGVFALLFLLAVFLAFVVYVL